MFEGSRIELSKSALAANLQVIRGLLDHDTVLSSVIKGNAYGHGICEVVELLKAEGVTHYSVFNTEEAFAAFQLLESTDTLLVMGDVDGEALEWVIQNDIEFFVSDISRLEHAIEIARKLEKPAKVHLEFETGMNRTGLSIDHFKQAIELLKKNRNNVLFKGLCTHFAGAESVANYHRIQSQIRKYRRAQKYCRKQDLQPKQCHTSCSAGVLRYPKMNLDLVRVGILQYGHWPSTETYIEHLTKKKITEDPLRRVLTWKSSVMNTKSVKTGQFVGYGSSYLATSDIRIAIIPVGYAHGYSRTLSNQGHVLIQGKRAPVIGTINMNALTVDITKIPEADKGDEVVLIGQFGDEAVTVSSFGELSNQLNYELLTRLPSSIPRFVVN